MVRGTCTTLEQLLSSRVLYLVSWSSLYKRQVQVLYIDCTVPLLQYVDCVLIFNSGTGGLVPVRIIRGLADYWYNYLYAFLFQICI